jgi:hypothetical protein
MSGPFIPPTPEKAVDSSPPTMDSDDDYTDEFDNHNCIMANEDSTSVEEVASDGFDIDFENEISDGVPRACTISNFLHDNDNDQDDDNDDDDDDDDDNDVKEQLVLSTRNGDKYEYCDQKESLTSPDDTIQW